MPALLITFSGSEERVDVERTGGSITVTIDGETHTLSSDDAETLRESVDDALTRREEFFRTAGVHREDGRYEVERRGAESAGNSTVFEDFEEARRLFERLPETFGADALSRAGITGSRRHMLVRHFAEHPSFPCELSSRNPLEATKCPESTQGTGRIPARAD
ncbi:MAG: hypothetical protein ABEI31_04485 [Halodesulfurarchaeum sp.]